MSPTGATKEVGDSNALEALRELVVNLYVAQRAGLSHLLRLQHSEAINLDDLEVMGAFATSVYYGSDIPESISRLQTAVRIAKKRAA